MADRSNIAKGDDRAPARAANILAKGVSDGQWKAWKAVEALMAGKEADDLKALQQAADDAIRYLTTETRPDPAPGEDRLWHKGHEPGEPCWFHDKGRGGARRARG